MGERRYAVLSAMGPDRPGLVARLTELIAECGGNVEDSRMAVLGGAFGILVLVSGTAEALHAIAEAGGEAEVELGLRIHTAPTTAPRQPSGSRRFKVTVEAADREGIVHAVTEALYELDGNIVDLESTVYAAPISGTPLFRLRLLADVPADVAVDRLRRALDEVAAAENLDIDAQPLGETPNALA